MSYKAQKREDGILDVPAISKGGYKNIITPRSEPRMHRHHMIKFFPRRPQAQNMVTMYGVYYGAGIKSFDQITSTVEDYLLRLAREKNKYL